ncbi:MAG: NADH-quinone oxidoreductase subunit NuoE [Paracoccaceae bacterium]
MLRRLHTEQPDAFAFTPDNQAWAEAQITKYPEGRQASAIIPLLWRAQEQEGWLTRPAIECVSDMLGLAYIRGLEVASFYFMFQLKPVGKIAHFQICGTTSCMICGAEDLVAVCKDKIAAKPHMLSEDGNLSWEEVECLGACANAPMAQIGKDYYEDLTADRFSEIIDEIVAGKVPMPGPQNGRYASEPLSGLTSLQDHASGRAKFNASAQLASDIGDTLKRIDGTEVPLIAPWQGKSGANLTARPSQTKPRAEPAPKPKPFEKSQATEATVSSVSADDKPEQLGSARNGQPDDLKLIKGVGPKLESLLFDLGFFHFDQIANWRDNEVAWVDENLQGFKGRVSRDNWVAQAKTLAEGGATEFSLRAKKSNIHKE